MSGRESRILLVRHGETEWNREDRWQGSGSDVPLNDRGRNQAREVAEAISGRDASALYSSDLQRALETARIVGDRLGLEPRVDSAFREMNHGHWEGRTKAEILEGWSAEYHAFEADPRGVRRPGGDSYGDLADRLWPALEEVADRHRAARAIVVTHGGPIRLVLADVLGRPLAERDAFGVDNGSWFEVERSGAGWRVLERGRPGC
ncbi:MAG: histidine phosphatase family protein [Gemmatimonadota bacterium]|nr:histidine phosphatase family protein [Gemmatimonadota bacterium]